MPVSFLKHETTQSLPQPSFTYTKATLVTWNMVNQAKRAQVHRIYLGQSKPGAGRSTLCPRQRSFRACCKASELGVNVHPALTPFLLYLCFVLTACRSRCQPNGESCPVTPKSSRSGGRRTARERAGPSLPAERVTGTRRDPSNRAVSWHKRKRDKAIPKSRTPASGGFGCSRRCPGGDAGPSSNPRGAHTGGMVGSLPEFESEAVLATGLGQHLAIHPIIVTVIFC